VCKIEDMKEEELAKGKTDNSSRAAFDSSNEKNSIDNRRKEVADVGAHLNFGAVKVKTETLPTLRFTKQ
jgi:hypothetical protein